MIGDNLKIKLRRSPLYQWAALQYRNAEKLRQFNREVKRLAQYEPGGQTVEQLLDIQSPIFSSNQKQEEITQLLRLLEAQKPKTMLEIGTYRGGTLFLFSRVSSPAARIISLDFRYPSPEYFKSLSKLAARGQNIRCIQADSHAPETLQRINRLLGGQPLDFLFIDGDHSYAGVKRDFELYAPLVRPGGIIAFHDIVPDYQTRRGQKTKAYTGGVPVFWNEIKTAAETTFEFIADPEQDGYGIGVCQQEAQNRE